MNEKLFPVDLPKCEWVEFKAEGYSSPVSGVIYDSAGVQPVCGMPLGGLATGCIDVEANGLWGFSSIFNSLAPRYGQINMPFLGISVGAQAWTLTTLNMQWRDDVVHLDKAQRFGVQHAGQPFKASRIASQIHYWGHYPIVDMAFMTDCPVQVALRAWSSFIPGDVESSNIPGAVFEVHLRNTTDTEQSGSLVFSFPGPSETEAGTTCFTRQELSGEVRGISVASMQASCVIGAIGESNVRVGGELGMDGASWSTFMGGLPYAKTQGGASVAVDYSIGPRQDKIVRFVLAWHCPVWKGPGLMTDKGNSYTHMYTAKFKDAVETAHLLASQSDVLLKRILAWQEVVYREKDYPLWLRDSLINVLHLITETAVWAQAKPPIGEWCQPEDGLFAMNESPRWCPQMECIPCGFYGSLPLAYFFPKLAMSTLRAYKAYQGPKGRTPWIFGGCTGGCRADSGAYDLVTPILERNVGPQTTLNGACYVEMVDKLWRCSGDDGVLREFYESVKKNTIFTMRDLCPDLGPEAVVRMPTAGLPNHDWFEFCEMLGIVPHVGGIHLAQLRMAKRMAESMRDDEFVKRCDEWIERGSAVMEEHTWLGTHYMLYNELETGKKQDDVVFGYQLDGESIALSHGLRGVFRPDRVQATLETLKKTNLAITDAGAVTFCKPGGAELGQDDWDPGFWGKRGVHPPGTWMLAMIYMYRGQRAFGLDLARRPVEAVVKRGWYWDWPCVIDGSSPRVGSDYYQMLFLWSLAAAAKGQDIAGPCQASGLVERMIAAGRPTVMDGRDEELKP